jgi:hypothetical protein
MHTTQENVNKHSLFCCSKGLIVSNWHEAFPGQAKCDRTGVHGSHQNKQQSERTGLREGTLRCKAWRHCAPAAAAAAAQLMNLWTLLTLSRNCTASVESKDALDDPAL